MILFLVDFRLWLLYFLKGEGGWFYIAKKADVAHISKGKHTIYFKICLNRLPSVRPKQTRGQPSKNGGGDSETSPVVYVEAFRGLVYVVSNC